MRRKNIVEIMAMLQHLRAGASNSQINRELGVSRRTARNYRRWAEDNGFVSEYMSKHAVGNFLSRKACTMSDLITE